MNEFWKTDMTDKPKIIVLCGSSRFTDVMAVCAWLLERDEGAITMGLHLLPWWYPDCPESHLAEQEGCAHRMDNLHLRKIDLADEIFVVNAQDYIGSSTSNEITYAANKSLKIRYFMIDPVGTKVQQLMAEAAAKYKD